MPIHEYDCYRGHITEVFVGKEEIPAMCVHVTEVIQLDGEKVSGPCCGVLRRIIGKTSFALRGDGWAKDGYSK